MRNPRAKLPELHELEEMAKTPDKFSEIIFQNEWGSLIYRGFGTDENPDNFNHSLRFIRMWLKAREADIEFERAAELAQKNGKLF